MGLLGLSCLLDKPDPEELNNGSICMKSCTKKTAMSLTPTMSYKIDWLSFTFPEDSKITVKKILDYLAYDEANFEKIPGRYFYNAGLSIGYYFNIFYNDYSKEVSKNASRTINFQITGVGCTDLGTHLEEIYDSSDYEQNWLKFLEWLTGLGCKIRRIDWALDDFKGECNFEIMIRHLKAGTYRSFKKTYSISRGADQKQRSNGLTIYIGKMPKGGSGSSGVVYARFYKKLAEFNAKHQLAPTIARKSGVWDRYEISFSKKKAESAVNQFIENGSLGIVYFGVLRSLVEFLNPKKNSRGNYYRNKDKWQVCPWWSNFLRHAKKVRVGSDAQREVSFSDLLFWIRTSVVPSLRLLEQVGLEKNFDVYKLIKQCDVNFSKKQKRLLRDSKHIPDELLELYLDEFVQGYKK